GLQIERRERDLRGGDAVREEIGAEIGEGDLLIPISPDDQEARPLRIGQQETEQRARGRVGRLQIVQEQHDWTLERLDEALDEEAEAVLRLRRPELGRRRLAGAEGP